MFFKYDEEDENIVTCFKWFLLEGYAVTSINGRLLSYHRLVMGVPNGQVDHINRNRLDNRKCNLRIVTPSDNQLNKSGTNKIYKNKCGKFLFRIKRHGNIGEFTGYGSESCARRALGFMKNTIINQGSSISGTYYIPICYRSDYIGRNFQKFKTVRSKADKKIKQKHFADNYMKTCSRKLNLAERVFIATTPDSFNDVAIAYKLHETQFYRIRKDWSVLTDCQKNKIIEFLAN